VINDVADGTAIFGGPALRNVNVNEWHVISLVVNVVQTFWLRAQHQTTDFNRDMK
jgi:hypothetical protein